LQITREIIDEILESELPVIEKGKRDIVSSNIFSRLNKMFKDYDNNLSSIHAKKSSYYGIPIVEFDYLAGRTNFVELNNCCAVRTRGISIVGKVIRIKDKYMIIKTAEIGKVKMIYSKITGMFPCSLQDNYFERRGEKH